MSMVRFLDLKEQHQGIVAELEAAVSRVIRSGWYILGPEVASFEEAFASYCGARYAVGLASGLDALVLGLLALGISSGDEVIVPSNTYIATWLAVSHCGAVPVPVEPDPRTYNIDPQRIEAAITKRTKAIVPVHLYGQAADMDAIRTVAEKWGLSVLDDAAQAHGARYKGRRIGADADVTAWSFYPSKNLGALGDGGAITSNDAEIAERIRVLRNYGSKTKYVNLVRGYNSRLDPLQAAVLSVKLKYLDAWNAHRMRIARIYDAGITGAVRPYVPEWADPVWHVYVVRHPRRDELQAKLQRDGIETLIHYPIAPHEQAAYAEFRWVPDAFPLARRLAGEVLSLPMGPHVTDADAVQVIEALNASAEV